MDIFDMSIESKVIDIAMSLVDQFAKATPQQLFYWRRIEICYQYFTLMTVAKDKETAILSIVGSLLVDKHTRDWVEGQLRHRKEPEIRPFAPNMLISLVD